ncbi:MAG: hypothetical protein NT170_02700 [Candidatus Moranbacteria bacterium]|nr:hypothetical protein [Candidatus Moranbacteria bacterium]
MESLNRGNNTDHLASVVNQPDRGYSDILIDSNARAGIYRTAVKKSSSYGFLFKNYCGDGENRQPEADPPWAETPGS